MTGNAIEPDDATVERVAAAMYQQFHAAAADMSPDELPHTYSPWGVDSVVTTFWHDVTRAGLTALRIVGRGFVWLSDDGQYLDTAPPLSVSDRNEHLEENCG